MKSRTKPQNNSLHKWCEEVAREAQNIGLPLRVIYDKIDVEWTKEAVKHLVQSIARAKFGTSHTSELTTTQLTDCVQEVDKMFLEEGLNVPFPSRELESLNQYTTWQN